MLDAVPAALQKPVVNHDIKFFPQDEYQCGPASLAMVLHSQGLQVTPEVLRDQVYIPGRQGSLQLELLAATRRYGLIPYELRPELEELLLEVRKGRPVLVFQNLGVSWYPQWHYAVVIGFNLQEKTIMLHTGVSSAYEMNIFTFERTWMRTKRWAMIALHPGEMPVQPEQWRYIRASVGLERINKPDLVRQAYDAGLKHWPDSRELNMGMGNYHYGQGERKLAEKYYRKVIAVSPDFAAAYNNLAQVLMEQGRLKEALESAEQAISLGGAHASQYRATMQDIRTKLKHSR